LETRRQPDIGAATSPVSTDQLQEVSMTSVAQAPTSPASPAPAHPTPERIFTALSAYERTAALSAAIELELFTAIGEGATTQEALAKRTGAAERGVRILADYLVVDGFLTKHSGHYGLAPEAAAFLDQRSPMYLGTMSRFLGTPDFTRRFERLAEAVRHGGSVEENHMVVPRQPLWVEFARSMAALQAPVAGLVAEAVGLAERVLDLAAGHGLFGIAVARANPGATIVAQDWEEVLAVARENAERDGVADRLRLLPGSAFEVDFGSGLDLVLVPNFLHHFDAPTCVALLRRVHDALAPDGRAAIVEFVPDESRVAPPIPAAFSLKMLAATPGGDAYTYGELDRMCREAGFRATELKPLAPTQQTLVIALR
jgi:2-polyprenyl-3-methyl-5-hydroxy-6-metoxy-1,4-benzoquinol methylase